MTTRWTVNINDIERGARIAIGGMAAVAGVFLLTAAASALAVVLEVLLIAVGLDLVVTGVTGHCPLYARLGHIPSSLQGRTS